MNDNIFRTEDTASGEGVINSREGEADK